jgi:hypothetical protein
MTLIIIICGIDLSVTLGVTYILLKNHPKPAKRLGVFSTTHRICSQPPSGADRQSSLSITYMHMGGGAIG